MKKTLIANTAMIYCRSNNIGLAGESGFLSNVEMHFV